jgi:RNA polymerase sigma-70 factor (ECF subfamily)
MKLLRAGHVPVMSLRRAQAAAARPLELGPPALSAPTFDELYEAHVDFLWRNARRLGVRDDAVDDVLQHVFMVVHRRLVDVTRAGSERAFLFGILVRVVREHNRSLRRKSPHGFHEATDPDVLPDDHARRADDAVARAEAAQLLQRWLDALDDDKREVFVLADLEQMTAREIAEATGTNPRTVASRLRAARLQIEDAAQRHRRREEREASWRS